MSLWNRLIVKSLWKLYCRRTYKSYGFFKLYFEKEELCLYQSMRRDGTGGTGRKSSRCGMGRDTKARETGWDGIFKEKWCGMGRAGHHFLSSRGALVYTMWVYYSVIENLCEKWTNQMRSLILVHSHLFRSLILDRINDPIAEYSLFSEKVDAHV